MKAKLVVVGGDVKAAEISLKLPAIIGRGREATLTLPHPLVSRKHCELYEANGALMVRDLGSLNGTYVGSQRVEEAVLPAGELLTVATVNFRAVYSEADADSTDPPYDVGNSDSTHGVGREKPSQPASRPSDPRDPPPPPRPAPANTPPIERDTEWQVGNAPPRDSSKDHDDLSSLLNEKRNR